MNRSEKQAGGSTSRVNRNCPRRDPHRFGLSEEDRILTFSAIEKRLCILVFCLAAFHWATGAENTVPIVTEGKSAWRIVTVSQGPTVSFAAGELRRYVE